MKSVYCSDLFDGDDCDDDDDDDDVGKVPHFNGTYFHVHQSSYPIIFWERSVGV